MTNQPACRTGASSPPRANTCHATASNACSSTAVGEFSRTHDSRLHILRKCRRFNPRLTRLTPASGPDFRIALKSLVKRGARELSDDNIGPTRALRDTVMSMHEGLTTYLITATGAVDALGLDDETKTAFLAGNASRIFKL